MIFYYKRIKTLKESMIMKKTLAIVACLFAFNALQAASKAWITKIENTSPFYVTFQSTDPSAKNLVNENCWLRNDSYIVAPKSQILLKDAVIPWQSAGGSIRISVNGVELSGNPFTTAQATVQEINGEIWLDTGTKKNKVTRAESFSVIVAKDGAISLRNN